MPDRVRLVSQANYSLEEVNVAPNIAGLQEAVLKGMLGERDAKFAQDLLDFYEKKKYLSAGQLPYVDKLIERAQRKAIVPTEVGQFGGVYTLLEKAKTHLKFPKLALMLPDGSRIKVYLATSKSRVPNVVNVVSLKSTEWYGRVFPTGRWEPSYLGTKMKDDLEPLLRRLADDPAGVAAEYGKLTGNCCMCNKLLSDARSTSVGYGPACADNFGLPWG